MQKPDLILGGHFLNILADGSPCCMQTRPRLYWRHLPGDCWCESTAPFVDAVEMTGDLLAFQSVFDGVAGLRIAWHRMAGLLLAGVRLDRGQTRTLDTLRIRFGDWAHL